MGIGSLVPSAVKSVAGSLGGSLGGALISGPAAILGAAGIGALGAAYSGKQSQASAKAQMEFQRQMSNTSFQRGMNDLRKAGLNPILAAKIGGASTPMGAGFQTPNIGEAAVQGAHSAQNMRQTQAQIDNLALQNQVLGTQATRAGIENMALSAHPSIAVAHMLKGVSLPTLTAIELYMRSLKDDTQTNAKDGNAPKPTTIEIKGDKNSNWNPHEKKNNRLSKEENDQINDAWKRGDVYNATEWW